MLQYTLHINQCFVTVKSLLTWIIIIYIIHKSLFCNSQVTLINSIFDSVTVQLETWFNAQCWILRTSITKNPLDSR